jgi:hypothetical protein
MALGEKWLRGEAVALEERAPDWCLAVPGSNSAFPQSTVLELSIPR